MSGYAGAEHVFGRSRTIRLGSSCYIQWQSKLNHLGLTSTIPLTKLQYNLINKMLGEIVDTDIQTGNYGQQSIRYKHKQQNKNYNRVKRFLKKEGIL